VTTKYIHFIVLNLFLEEEELLLLAPVTEGLNQASEENSEEDCCRIHPGDIGREEAEDEAGGAQHKQDLHVELVKLVPEDVPEGADLGKRTRIFAEEFLSALNIFHVTNDARLGIGD